MNRSMLPFQDALEFPRIDMDLNEGYNEIVEGYDEEAAKLWTSVKVWMERNQVGRAILHPSVGPTIIPTLWPKVFHNAVRNRSVLYKAFAVEGPPLDGLYYFVQHFAMGGYFDACRNGARSSSMRKDDSPKNREESMDTTDSSPVLQRIRLC